MVVSPDFLSVQAFISHAKSFSILLAFGSLHAWGGGHLSIGKGDSEVVKEIQHRGISMEGGREGGKKVRVNVNKNCVPQVNFDLWQPFFFEDILGREYSKAVYHPLFLPGMSWEHCTACQRPGRPVLLPRDPVGNETPSLGLCS